VRPSNSWRLLYAWNLQHATDIYTESSGCKTRHSLALPKLDWLTTSAHLRCCLRLSPTYLNCLANGGRSTLLCGIKKAESTVEQPALPEVVDRCLISIGIGGLQVFVGSQIGRCDVAIGGQKQPSDTFPAP